MTNNFNDVLKPADRRAGKAATARAHRQVTAESFSMS